MELISQSGREKQNCLLMVNRGGCFFGIRRYYDFIIATENVQSYYEGGKIYQLKNRKLKASIKEQLWTLGWLNKVNLNIFIRTKKWD